MNGARSYYLDRSRSDRLEEERLHQAGETAFRRSLEIALRAVSLSAAERERTISPQSQLAATLSDPAGESGLRMLAELSPEHLRALVSGHEISLNLRGISGYASGAANDLMVRMARPGRASRDDYNVIRMRRDGTDADSGIVIELSGRNVRHGFRVNLCWREEAYEATQGRRDPESQKMRRPLILAGPISDPSLDRLLLRLADAAGINLVAESYHEFQPHALSLSQAKTTVEQALDNLMFSDRIWWKSGSVYLVQKRYWFLDRRYQVDHDLVERLKRATRGQDLTLEDCIRVSLLSSPQLKALDAMGLGRFHIQQEVAALVSFYAGLRDDERRSLFSEFGLSASALNKAQFATFMRSIASVESPREPRQLIQNRPTMRVRGFVEGGRSIFRAWLSDATEDTPLWEQSIFAIPAFTLRTLIGH